MLSTAQKLRETFLIGALKIVLPTVDVYSDGATIIQLYRGWSYNPNCNMKYESEIVNATEYEACLTDTGIPREELHYDHHPTWATMLLVPFLLNYIMGWYRWYKIDKKKKRFTWLACLLGLYPQLRAVNVIRTIWRDPQRGLDEKKRFEREIAEAEVFLEAVPTFFVLKYIDGRSKTALQLTRIHKRKISNSSLSDWRAAIIMGNDSLFQITLFSSWITASLGMAKVLKVKICCDRNSNLDLEGRSLQGGC